MTTKVVKGSFWTLLGQVIPLFASFFATPFVIRLLGAESYGVYILVGLIPTYFSFADFGMNIGSTKFSSEAYARRSREDEGRVVRTAALIAFLTSFPFAVALFLFSYNIIVWLNVPEHLLSQASIALKLASITFVLNILCSIFNTPQLSRLRMDLNSFVSSGFRLLGIVGAPVVLYFGGGIIGAISALLIASLLTLLGHIYVSGKLLNELFQLSIDQKIIKPLLKFGYSLVIAGIAGILLVNLEKVVLARVTSIESLAYYSIAFMLANIATMFSGAMVQSLLPAFSQLLDPERKNELNNLFSRSIKINLIGFLPLMMFLLVISKPFFTIWAGEKFGQESTTPFYFLLFGLLFNILAYIPHSILLASGRTDIFAKLYWIELFPYIFLVGLLTYKFGAVGTAIAWSIRVVIDAVIIIWLSKKIVGVSLNIFQEKFWFLLSIFLLFIPQILIMSYSSNFYVLLIFSSLFSFILYFVIIWTKVVKIEERLWIKEKISAYF